MFVYIILETRGSVFLASRKKLRRNSSAIVKWRCTENMRLKKQTCGDTRTVTQLTECDVGLLI